MKTFFDGDEVEDCEMRQSAFYSVEFASSQTADVDILRSTSCSSIPFLIPFVVSTSLCAQFFQSYGDLNQSSRKQDHKLLNTPLVREPHQPCLIDIVSYQVFVF